MVLSKETTVILTNVEVNILGHINYAAYKLWNVCNYERNNYKDLDLSEYPDWYYQKKAHKENIWYRSLPSQIAQEVCKTLDKSWKSYFKLLKTGGIENLHPPRFKHNGIPVTYMQNGIVHKQGSDRGRLTISKAFMAKEYDIYEDYLFLKNEIFRSMDSIKQIKLYELKGTIARVIVIYEIPEVKMMEDNGNYLSIDLGVKNPFTCYDSEDKSFIVGKRFLSILHYYDKKITYYQSISSSQQLAAGIGYPKPSKRILALYVKKRNALNDYLHKCTRYIADYCRNNGINRVIIGDITGIRKGYDKGDRLNQQFHSLPYAQIYTMLEYKPKLYGITLIKQNEAYSPHVSPLAKEVCRENAHDSGRVKRCLYKDGNSIYNADAVGAYNILRLYIGRSYPNKSLINPTKVAV